MPTSLRLLAALLLLTAVQASAQTAGTVLWKADVSGFAVMSQPRVAPDGTIYLVTNQLYAFNPDGTVKWTGLGYESYIDVGPDGTVYTGAGSTIYAYNPDGTLKWSFTEPPGGQGLMQGPTVGPDGNIYAVTDAGGLGALSLTPQGELRWNVPGFVDREGTGLGRIQFGPSNLYFAEDVAPGCSPLTEGMASVTLDGQLDWCISISGVARPTATLDGKAVTYQEGLSGKTLLAYNPDGDVVWTYTYDFNENEILNVGVGPDNNLYVWNIGTLLSSLTAGGDVRWKEGQPVNNFPWRAAVAPDLSAVVSGSVYGFGNNGTIIAADPADGSTLWTVPVTGPSAGAGAPAEFSPDGSVVYVPVNTISFDVPDQLWAIQVHDAGPPPSLDVAVALVSGAPVPPSGGTVRYEVAVTNATGQSQTTQLWTELALPSGAVRTQGPLSVTVAAGATFRRTLSQRLPAGAPSGTYTLTAEVGTYPAPVVDSDAASFEKLAAAAATANVGDPTLVEGHALSAVYPNPFVQQARFTVAVAEAEQVRVEVYDALGRRVALLHEGVLPAGAPHAFTLDGTALPNGLYVVRITGETFGATERVTLLR